MWANSGRFPRKANNDTKGADAVAATVAAAVAAVVAAVVAAAVAAAVAATHDADDWERFALGASKWKKSLKQNVVFWNKFSAHMHIRTQQIFDGTQY